MSSAALTNATLRVYVRAYCDPHRASEAERAWLSRNPIEGWDVSRVTDMSNLFFYKHLFNADLSRWDVSRVTNMEGMFSHATAFNQPLGAWKVT
jgi:surface protein